MHPLRPDRTLRTCWFRTPQRTVGYRRGPRPMAPALDSAPVAIVQTPSLPSSPATPTRTHVVGRGESLWTIARRYKLQVADLMSRNALQARSVLRPGMVLQLDAPSD